MHLVAHGIRRLLLLQALLAQLQEYDRNTPLLNSRISETHCHTSSGRPTQYFSPRGEASSDDQEVMDNLDKWLYHNLEDADDLYLQQMIEWLRSTLIEGNSLISLEYPKYAGDYLMFASIYLLLNHACTEAVTIRGTIATLADDEDGDAPRCNSPWGQDELEIALCRYKFGTCAVSDYARLRSSWDSSFLCDHSPNEQECEPELDTTGTDFELSRQSVDSRMLLDSVSHPRISPFSQMLREGRNSTSPVTLGEGDMRYTEALQVPTDLQSERLHEMLKVQTGFNRP